jgi:hypothetical protein
MDTRLKKAPLSSEFFERFVLFGEAIGRKDFS